MICGADIDKALQGLSDEATRRLLAQVIEPLLTENAYLREQIQRLRDEVNRLKGEQGKPAFKSGKGGSNKGSRNKGSRNEGSRNEGSRKDPGGDAGQDTVQPAGSAETSTDISSEKERRSPNPWHKGSKADRIVVHREQRVDQPPPDLPADAVAGGYVPYVVQDIVIAPLNTRFLRASWYSASQRRTYLAPLPPGYEGRFGPGVHTLVPALHFIGSVSQPGIRQFVESAGVFISSGTVSNILVKGAQPFYSEYDSIFRAGLESSPWQCTDHTTSPVNGELHQCQIIGNPCYTTFATSPSKSRLSIVQVLLNPAHSNEDGPSDKKPMPAYLLDKRACDYHSRLRCPRPIIEALKKLPQGVEFCEGEFHLFLAERVAPAIRKRVRDGQAVKPALTEQRLKQICEAAAIAFYHAQQDWPVVDTILAHDASAFREITNGHSLCWVHEGRLYKKLIPYLQQHPEAVDRFLARFWKYYDALLRYRLKPTPGAK